MKTPSDDEWVLMKEIGDPKMPRKTFAVSYSIARENEWLVDWERVNSAVVTRWGAAGLRWIQQEAEQLIAAKRKHEAEVNTRSGEFGA